MTENEKGSEQERDKGPSVSIGLRIFIVVNIILFAGVAAWWVQGFVQKSAAQAEIEKAQQEKSMEEMIAANPAPRESGEPSYQTSTYVIDASDRIKWIHFSFGEMRIFAADKIAADSDRWDLVLRRSKILTNGGATGKAGKAEVAVTMAQSFDSVTVPPKLGYYKDVTTENIMENKNPALEKWYDYNFLTHKLNPRKAVYVMKTGRGDFVKFELQSYYCADLAACYSIKYAFLKPQ
ncbi:MAG: HmuY family protein [Nitrospinota bacterium]|nr:HmuY family protein [Nitrospinota bacterium]